MTPLTSKLQEAVASLAPTGRLRAAINFGNPVLAQKDAVTGNPCGVSVELAHALGERLGLTVDLVTFDAAGKVVDALKADVWDVAFLAIDPVRAAEIAFTAPYVVIEGTYLVHADSPFHAVEELDRQGVRIAVGRGAAYDLFLTRALKQAEIVRVDTSAAAIDLFLAGGLDAAAGVRQPLSMAARMHPGVRVIDGRFTSIEQAVGLPRSRVVGLPYLGAFIEEMKANGFVAAALARSGREDAAVATAAS